MAVDDVVNGISADNTIIDLQPASGVEVIITSVQMDGSSSEFAMFNDTNPSRMNGTEYSTKNIPFNTKMCLNNAIFLRVFAGGIGKFLGFTGITIK